MPLKRDLTEMSTAAQVLATFDFTDIQNGLGFEIFYGLVSNTSAGIVYALGDTNIEGTGSGGLSKVSGTATLNLSPFNTPTTIKGIGYVNMSYVGGSGASTQKVQIFHVNPTTGETDISSGGITAQVINSGIDVRISFSIPMTEKVFAEGDWIRIKLTGGTFVWGSLAEPCEFHIPFKLDI